MNAFEFAKHAVGLCAKHSFIQGVDILLLDEPVAKCLIEKTIKRRFFLSIEYVV